MDPDRLKSLPPVARIKALHQPLPKTRRVPWLALAITLGVHAALVAAIWFTRGPERVNIVWVNLLPLPDWAMRGESRPPADPPSAAPPSSAPAAAAAAPEPPPAP